MSAAVWEFEEALECFRVIDSSLRCIYSGELHMYRALSAQLRILLCDSPKPLLIRLFANLELQRLQSVKSYAQGELPPELGHLNSIAAVGSKSINVSCMPFEARIYFNGIEDCVPLLCPHGAMLPIKDWVEQVVSTYPVPVTIRQLIRDIADRGGGAHVHTSPYVRLERLKGLSPGKLHLPALVLVGISKVVQQLGYSVFQLYEKNGPRGSLPLKDFNWTHPSVLTSARVPKVCMERPYQAINLLSVWPS